MSSQPKTIPLDQLHARQNVSNVQDDAEYLRDRIKVLEAEVKRLRGWTPPAARCIVETDREYAAALTEEIMFAHLDRLQGQRNPDAHLGHEGAE